MGLIHWLADEPELPPLLTPAGSQYLDLKGEVDSEVLHFLPSVIDDLHTRKALLHGGTVLVDEFRYELLHDRGVSHAQGLVPDAFVSAVDDRMAVNLFAASVGLMARLSCGRPAGCLAEEIVAVTLIANATFWIEMEAENGNLDPDAVEHATGALDGIFELFEDDDVLSMFEMEEPSDAAVAGHSWINRQAGVVDQRVESWFRPFGPVADTGYLESERPPSSPTELEAPLVVVEPGEALELNRGHGPGRFRVIVRLWEDDFLERPESGQMPGTWIYYLDAASAGAAMEQVNRRFPEGSSSAIADDLVDSATLERQDLARISVDVQRANLPQKFSEGRSFHVAGQLDGLEGRELLGQLAAALSASFPAAVVMTEGQRSYFAVSMNAESHEEADANLEEVLDAFGETVGLTDYPVNGSSLGQGERRPHELIEEIESYRRVG